MDINMIKGWAVVLAIFIGIPLLIMKLSSKSKKDFGDSVGTFAGVIAFAIFIAIVAKIGAWLFNTDEDSGLGYMWLLFLGILFAVAYGATKKS